MHAMQATIYMNKYIHVLFFFFFFFFFFFMIFLGFSSWLYDDMLHCIPIPSSLPSSVNGKERSHSDGYYVY